MGSDTHLVTAKSHLAYRAVPTLRAGKGKTAGGFWSGSEHFSTHAGLITISIFAEKLYPLMINFKYSM